MRHDVIKSKFICLDYIFEPILKEGPRTRTLSILEALITSVLSERPFKSADRKTERGKIFNPEYDICRDQPIAGASPLRINTLFYSVLRSTGNFYRVINRVLPPSLTASVIRSSGRRSPRLSIPESVTSSQSVRSRRFT